MAARSQILGLYKELLKEGRKFRSYNFREYAVRRIRDEFKENQNVADPSKIQSFISKGKQQLESLRRQTVINNLYYQQELVIEKVKKA
jgi:hypothetical protein